MIEHPGKLLRRLREAEGLKQRQVAEKCGLSISFISDVERGRSWPSMRNFAAWLDALEYTLEMRIKRK
jgi:transcriptional regulator with XRE-family HTH domain